MEKDPNMQGRRTASRATKLRRRKARMNFILLAGFIALVVLLVVVTPKEPLRRRMWEVFLDLWSLWKHTKIQTILSMKKCWSGSVICGDRNLISGA